MARYGDDMNRDRWRENGREDNRGFFERAGDEVRSWFTDDDDRNDRWSDSRSNWERDRDFNWMGSPRGSSWDRDQVRGGSSGQPGGSRGYGRGSWENEGRSTFGGMSQGGLGRSGGGWDREQGRSGWSGDSRDRFGSSKKDFGGFRDEEDFRSHRGHRRDHAQSWGEANRGENESLGYSEFRGTLGGFGNQKFGSSQDDHYRSWRDRQMSELDRDYDEYCREREQQFHQDFGAWRSNRQSQSPSALGNTPGSDANVASNAGVGTTTASIAGTAGSGSAIGSPTGTGGSTQSDTAETADAGASGRSGSRSRS